MWAGFVSAILLAFICAGIYAFTERSHVAEAQSATIVGVDADIDDNNDGTPDNTATSLGAINSCISVNPDSVFSIDLFIQEVTNLDAWDAIFQFDESVLEVNSLAVADFFLGSNVYTHLHCYTDGVCEVGGQDQSQSHAGHDGSGVLGRLEFTAIGTGISEANLDLRPPASMVVLRDGEGTPIGDDDGDGFFDGTILNATIAVGLPCPGECQPGVDTDGDGFDDDVECYLGTDPLDDCSNNPSHAAWPLDINNDQVVTVVGDVLWFAGLIGSTCDGSEFCKRLDLSGNGVITVVGDVLPFAGHIGDWCS